MVDRIFNFKVQAEPGGTAAFRTLSAQFGDGYVQMGADGINNRSLVYQITCKGATRVGCHPEATPQIQLVRAFLDERKGYQSFQWEPPGLGQTYRFTAAAYQWVHNGNGVYTLTTTFTQVYFP